MTVMPKAEQKSRFAHLDEVSKNILADEARARAAENTSRLWKFLVILIAIAVCGLFGLIRYWDEQEAAAKKAREQAEYDRQYKLAEKARIEREAYSKSPAGLLAAQAEARGKLQQEAKRAEEIETREAERKLRIIGGVLEQREKERLKQLRDAEIRRLGRALPD